MTTTPPDPAQINHTARPGAGWRRGRTLALGAALAALVSLALAPGARAQSVELVEPPTSPEPLAGRVGPPSTNAIAVSDFDGDGNLDQAVSGPPRGSGAGFISILLGDGSGDFGPAKTERSGDPQPADIAAGDFDGDGDPDLAVANRGAGDLSILLGDGDGGFTEAPSSPEPAGFEPSALAVGDLDGDGNQDLVVTTIGPFADQPGHVTIHLGDGDGDFAPAPIGAQEVGVAPQDVAVGDLDEDSNLDLVVNNQLSDNLTILLGEDDGTFAPAPGSPESLVSDPLQVLIGNLDGDPSPDLVSSGDNEVGALIGDGSGEFIPAGFPLSGLAPLDTLHKLAAADFDRDGDLDLALTDFGGEGGVRILLGDGDGGFTPAATGPIPVFSSPSAIAARDVDGDGDEDLSVVGANPVDDDGLAILLNQTPPPGGGENPPGGGENPPGGGENPPGPGEQPPAGGGQVPPRNVPVPSGDGAEPPRGNQPPDGGNQPPADAPRCGGEEATMVAAGEDRVIRGTAERDVIVATAGADAIKGRGGRDLICGLGGHDRLLGGGSSDDLRGQGGRDRLAGNGGRDRLRGGGGKDRLSGGSGRDRLSGGSRRDRCRGGGRDRLKSC